MGRFTYDPPRGVTGSDSFNYTLSSNGRTASAAVSMTVTARIWFIDSGSSCSSSCDGRQSHPYTSLGTFNTANTGAVPAPQPGDPIFIHTGSGNYVGPLTLRNTQKLFGQGASPTLATLTGLTAGPGQSLPATGGTAPNLTTTSGTLNVVNLAIDNRLQGLAIGNRTGVGIFGTSFGTLTVDETGINGTGQALNLTTGNLTGGGFTAITSTSAPADTGAGDDNSGNNVLLTGVTTTATFNLGSGALSGAAGSAFKIDGQNGTLTYSGTITNTSTLAVDIANKTGGAVTLSGDVNPSAAARGVSAVNNTGGTTLTFSGANKKVSVGGAGTGMGLTNNTGSTVTFSGSGGLTIDTTASTATAFFVSDTGNTTVNVSGTGNTITGSGQALSMSSAGAANAVTANMTFDSVSSSGGSRNVLLTRVNGSVNMNGGTLSGSTVTGVDIDRGTGSVTYAGDFNTPGRGISVANKTGGTVTFSGGTKTLSTDHGAAVTLTSNTGTTINFSNGGLGITTTTGAGFTATGGGTVSVTTGTNDNTISAGTASAALNVTTTIGAAGLPSRASPERRHQRHRAEHHRRERGIDRHRRRRRRARTARAAPSRTPPSVGISLTSARNVSLTQLNVSNTGNHGIERQLGHQLHLPGRDGDQRRQRQRRAGHQPPQPVRDVEPDRGRHHGRHHRGRHPGPPERHRRRHHGRADHPPADRPGPQGGIR